jgi:hypothetical protein
MCKINDEKSVKAILSKIRLSDYSKYFPDDAYDPSEQLLYIKNLVEKFKKEEDAENDKMCSIEEDIEKYKNNVDEHFALDAKRNFLGPIYMHHDALRANMQIAMLAPAIESLYKKSLYILVKEKLGESRLMDFFDKKKSFKGGRANCIMRALKELGFESKFHPDIKKYLSALFDYRNVLFHNGLEWDEKECEDFMGEKHRESWFTWHACSNKKACFYKDTCPDKRKHDLCSYKLSFILPTRKFIDELINFFEESMDSFVKSMQSSGENKQ